jgi:hypothetical protein
VHRGRYQAPDRNLGSEFLAVMCLSGAAAEELICGPISDDGDQIDIEMVRGYLRGALQRSAAGIAIRAYAYGCRASGSITAIKDRGRGRCCGRKRCKRGVEAAPGGYAHMLTFGQHRADRRFSTQCELSV